MCLASSPGYLFPSLRWILLVLKKGILIRGMAWSTHEKGSRYRIDLHRGHDVRPLASLCLHVLSYRLTKLTGKRLSESAKNPEQAVVAQHKSREPSTITDKMCAVSMRCDALDRLLSNGLQHKVPSCVDISEWTTPGKIGQHSTALHLPIDQVLLPSDPKTGAIIAVTENGNLLGLSCNGSKFDRSAPQPLSVPESLYPTPLQLATPHHDWIDRFPFPRFRDNMIILNDTIDVKAIFCDFFLMRSFSVKSDGASWDPDAWLISPEFNQKWGYLFY